MDGGNSRPQHALTTTTRIAFDFRQLLQDSRRESSPVRMKESYYSLPVSFDSRVSQSS